MNLSFNLHFIASLTSMFQYCLKQNVSGIVIMTFVINFEHNYPWEYDIIFPSTSYILLQLLSGNTHYVNMLPLYIFISACFLSATPVKSVSNDMLHLANVLILSTYSL